MVPHYVDYERASELARSVGIRVIDVRQLPEDFISELLSCDYILSSSLHGLILADAYNVPNLWIKISDRIIGGNFKYQDYYSTTNSGEQEPFKVVDGEDLKSINDAVDRLCSVKTYRYDIKRLLKAFPFS
jgi:pyruvyltransferase